MRQAALAAFAALAVIAIFDPFGLSKRAPPGCARVSIHAESGVIELLLEVAGNPFERARGLSGRSRVPFDGMLLAYPSSRSVVLTMRDTSIPLDLVFVGSGGIGMTNHVAAFEPRPVPSAGPVDAVLELAAGSVDTLRISVSDVVTIDPPTPCRSPARSRRRDPPAPDDGPQPASRGE